MPHNSQCFMIGNTMLWSIFFFRSAWISPPRIVISEGFNYLLICHQCHTHHLIIPVSYTHLDVYKRQGWHGTFRSRFSSGMPRFPALHPRFLPCLLYTSIWKTISDSTKLPLILRRASARLFFMQNHFSAVASPGLVVMSLYTAVSLGSRLENGIIDVYKRQAHKPSAQQAV